MANSVQAASIYSAHKERVMRQFSVRQRAYFIQQGIIVKLIPHEKPAPPLVVRVI